MIQYSNISRPFDLVIARHNGNRRATRRATFVPEWRGVDGSPLYGAPVFRYSVEFVHTRASYEWRAGPFWIRQFITLGVLARPLVAFDIDWYGDHNSVNSSAELGVLFAPKMSALAQVRVTLAGSDIRTSTELR